MTGRREVVLHNPYNVYSAQMIRTLDQLGFSTIAVFEDPVQLRRQSWHFPEIYSDAVSARYLVPRDRTPQFVRHLRDHHDVAGVIPVVEEFVLLSDQMAEQLGLDWAQGETRRRFRDKAALKEHLRGIPGGPRINASALVRTVDDVEQVLAGGSFSRFVLKPNDGFASRDLGFFESDDLEPVRRFLAAAGGRPLLLEEFIGGEEYFVNGQVDEAGEPTVISVASYDKHPFNDRPNVKFSMRYVRRHEPEFALLSDYAVQVLRASGLRRSPFHLEAKIDQQGPCLIEVAARLCGTGTAFLDSHAHGGSLDPFSLVARYVLSADHVDDLAPDWDEYDRVARGKLVGVSRRDERIQRLRGVSEVEAMPEFRWWWVRPEVGQRVERTADIMAPPYEVVLEGGGTEQLLDAFGRVRSAIAWNEDAGRVGPAHRVRAQLPVVGRRVREWAVRPRLSSWTDA